MYYGLTSDGYYNGISSSTQFEGSVELEKFVTEDEEHDRLIENNLDRQMACKYTYEGALCYYYWKFEPAKYTDIKTKKICDALLESNYITETQYKEITGEPYLA